MFKHSGVWSSSYSSPVYSLLDWGVLRRKLGSLKDPAGSLTEVLKNVLSPQVSEFIQWGDTIDFSPYKGIDDEYYYSTTI